MAQAERVVLSLAHRLHATRHDQTRGAGGYLHRGVEHRLQSRAATAVDLHPGHRRAEPGIECGDPADRGGLTIGVALAEHDVIHIAFGEARAGQQRRQC